MIQIPWEFWILSLLVIAVVGFFIGVWMNQSANREKLDYEENMVEVYKQRYLALERMFQFKPQDLEDDLLAHIKKLSVAPEGENWEDAQKRRGRQSGMVMALVLLRGRL